jgi:hypothetical protein
VTYAHKIEKAESAIDWRLSATVLDRRLRAFTLSRGSTQLGEETIKLWAAARALRRQRPARPGAGRRRPGRAVACGEGALRLTLQRAGGKRWPRRTFCAVSSCPWAASCNCHTCRSSHERSERPVAACHRHCTPAGLHAGVRDMLGTMPGIAAWGLVTGVAMVKSGMSLPLAVFMTLTIYAGSAQLAVLPLMAVGAPLWVLWFTAFCVNLRFVILSTMWRASSRTCGCATGWRSATSAAT